MRGSEWVRFVLRFEVIDPDRFREMAEQMVAVSRSEPGTLVYDWYLDESSRSGVLYEAYASHEALIAHSQGPVFTEIAPNYLDSVRIVSLDAFGAADALERRDMLGAPTMWWGAPIAAVTESERAAKD